MGGRLGAHLHDDAGEPPSGTYHVWLEADDQRNSPVRVYAPAPIVVDHSAAWEEAWAATLRATPHLRGLDLNWDAHAYPDVDGYALRVGTTPRAESQIEATEIYTVGLLLQTSVESLTAGQTYYLTLTAYDDEFGRTAVSQEIIVLPLGPEFAVAAGPTSLDLAAGAAGQSAITLTTSMDPFPTMVDLRLAPLPDGLAADFVSTVFTPTLAGVTASLSITVADSVPSGPYVLTVIGDSVGVTRSVDITVNVAGPYFELALPTDALSLAQGDDEELAVRRRSSSRRRARFIWWWTPALAPPPASSYWP